MQSQYWVMQNRRPVLAAFQQVGKPKAGYPSPHIMLQEVSGSRRRRRLVRRLQAAFNAGVEVPILVAATADQAAALASTLSFVASSGTLAQQLTRQGARHLSPRLYTLLLSSMLYLTPLPYTHEPFLVWLRYKEFHRATHIAEDSVGK